MTSSPALPSDEPALPVRAWLLAAVAVVAFCAFVPYLFTDGDSCVYGAGARAMARGGWRVWAAPTWDVLGTETCFHEHPPGALWATALVTRLGVSWLAAPLVANALWTLLALAGVIALARRFVSPAVAATAGIVFLLHAAPLKYVQRGSLEFPVAACAAWAVVAALRLREGWRWAAVLAAALAGAVLVRGAIGIVPWGVVAWLFVERDLRPPLGRVLVAGALAVAALAAFDLAHAAAAGHGFWGAYLDKQVLSSLADGGTRHSVEGPTWPYFVSRALVYSLPWSLLPAWGIVRRLRGGAPLAHPAAWRTAAVWIAGTIVGCSATTRLVSRYEFAAWVATSLLFALAVRPAVPAAWTRGLTRAAPFLVLALAAGKTLVQAHDPWRATAAVIGRWRATRPAGDAVAVRTPTLVEGGRLQGFLKFHADAQVRADPAPPPPGEFAWLIAGRRAEPGQRIVLETALGTLVTGASR